MGVYDEILSTGDIHSWSDAPFYYCTEDSKEKVIEGIIKYSKYHTDWNWLMKVIQKCAIIAAEEDEWEKYWQITDMIPNINATHESVIEFIKWYNKK